MPFFPLPKHCHPDFTSPGVKPTGPVEINWANPLARGLRAAYFIQNGRMHDVSRQNSLPTQDGGPLVRYDTRGARVELDGTNDNIDCGTNEATRVGLAPLTLVVGARASSTPQAAGETLIGRGRSATGGIRYDLAVTDTLVIAQVDDNVTKSQINFSHAITVGDYYQFAMVRGGGNVNVYARSDAFDGNASVTDSTGDISDFNGEPLTLGCIHDNLGAKQNFFGGGIYYALVYADDKSADELERLYKDPYQILRPAVDVYAFWASAGGTTYTVTGSLSAILQKQGIAKQATLNAILQKQGLSLNSSVDALLQKSVDITGEIDAILQKLGITSISSIDALLQKSVTASASLDAILTAITSSTETASIDAILKKLGITSTASLDSVLQKQGLNVSVYLSALLQKAVSLSSVIDAILQKTVTTSASLDAILTQAGSGSVSANFDAILRKTLSVNLSIDALLQKQDLTVYASLDALLQKRQTATASLDAILYGTASIAASLDALLKRTGVTITANLDAILTASSSFITPKNLVYVMAEDRIVTVLAEDRIVKVI